jgi:tRNA-splicing ligase RtcB (3'-phosphate/5'-hydroxy nucleic acid ligase)
MNKVITSERIPVKLWLSDIEDGAMVQAVNLARLPFAFHHIAIMPDAHQGYGMPIGGVLATSGAVVPNAVGVDIGCGMCAVRTSLTEYYPDPLKVAMGEIRSRVPVGFNHHSEKQEWEGFERAVDVPVVKKELQAAAHQIGTLGGGNHFMEIQYGDDGRVWLMLHSGSRNFGLKIANEFHAKAKVLCKKFHSSIPDPDLAFIPLGTHEADDYLSAMDYALSFALESRLRMISAMKESIRVAFGTVEFEDPINVHHNYARMENHFGHNVMVHRKGATSAKAGELGLIPGSQGTASYVVRGLGNPESFQSCSHGAGRKMGRKQACRELSLADEVKRLEDMGVIHGIRSEKDLDEAAGAYKDIDLVMANQADLVEVVTKLRPLAVIKA